MKTYFESEAKFLKLDIKFPYKEMLQEAIQLRDRFVTHRGAESKGWKSLTLHGFGEDKTGGWKTYGYSDPYKASEQMGWTPAALECPTTYNFFLNHFPCKKYGRLRFMLLEAGGYIGLHSDGNTRLLENINMVMNNPKGCEWQWGDGYPNLEMSDGDVFTINVSYHHRLVNTSNEDRYHIIVSRHDSTDEWKEIINIAAMRENISGKYIELDTLP